MPELHKLTTALSVLQDKGFRVAIVTDGRMSGASGKVLAEINLSPGPLIGGAIGKIRTWPKNALSPGSSHLKMRGNCVDFHLPY